MPWAINLRGRFLDIPGSNCLRLPAAALRGLENLFLSSNFLFNCIKSFLFKNISPLISIIFGKLLPLRFLGIFSIFETFLVTSSPTKPSPRVAAEIKNLKPVEPYKGKGIKEKGQYVLRKEGKKK